MRRSVFVPRLKSNLHNQFTRLELALASERTVTDAASVAVEGVSSKEGVWLFPFREHGSRWKISFSPNVKSEQKKKKESKGDPSGFITQQ